jgi:hypothetical protein
MQGPLVIDSNAGVMLKPLNLQDGDVGIVRVEGLDWTPLVG